MAPWQASHHKCGPGHSLLSLLLGRDQGAFCCPWTLWHLGSQAWTVRSHSQRSTATGFCWHGCAVSHSSPTFSGTWGLQSYAKAGHSLTCLPVWKGCPPTQELAVGLPSLDGAPAAFEGSQSHSALATAPRFNPCRAVAHHRQLWQSRQAEQAVPSP